MGKVADWIAARRDAITTLQQAVLGVLVVLLQWLGAGAVGYFYAQSQMRAFVIEERADHLAEIDRLQKNYADTLGYLTSKASATADAAEAAATQSAVAATEAKDTAKAAKRAVAPAAPATPSISEAQRADINRKIEAINRKVREKE